MAVILPSVDHLNNCDHLLPRLFRRNGFRGTIAWAMVGPRGAFIPPDYSNDFWPTVSARGRVAVWPYCRTEEEEDALVSVSSTNVIATQAELNTLIRERLQQC